MTAEGTRRPRRPRSVSEMLLSIVLGLEAVLVVFVTLAVFGLRALDPVPAFVGGVVLIGVLLAATQTLRYPWGVWLGWALQAVLLATGALLPAMYIVSAVFIAIWVYCFVRGRQIDRRNSSGETPAV